MEIDESSSLPNYVLEVRSMALDEKSGDLRVSSFSISTASSVSSLCDS